MEDSSKIIVKEAIIALVISVFVLAGLVVVFNEDIRSKIFGAVSPADLKPGDLGYILLNLTKDGEETNLYSFDVVGRSLSKMPNPIITPHASADMIIGTGVLDIDNKKSSSVFYNKGGGKFNILYASSTYKTAFYNARLSPSGTRYTFEVAPVYTDDESDVRYDANAWDIYLGLVNGSVYHIANGTSAHFSPDETVVLYMKDDGFHTYNIVTDEDELVWEPISGTVSSNMMTDVSDDGSKIVITNVLGGDVTVADIVGWHPFKLDNFRSYALKAFWPVFSPNGNIIAVQEVDWDISKDTEPSNAALTLINITNGEIEKVADLSDYKQEALLISEWISN